MGGILKVLWLVLVLALLVLLGQSLAWYNLPIIPDLRGMLPIVQTLGAAAPTPDALPAQPAPQPSPAASPAVAQPEVCTASAPRFVQGAAGLKARVGAAMGDPLECERVVDAAGNTEQKTTTGLAYYRANSNITVFTNGVEHWALTSDGLAHWTSDDVEPPPGGDVQQ